jgi:Matrixin
MRQRTLVHTGIRTLVVALAVLVFAVCAKPAKSEVVPLSAEQMVHGSRQIVVARVESKQGRWNELHTLIMTDYSLRIEDRLRGEVPDRVTLTMPGGTVAGETHDTSLSVHLRTGSRYLLFCRDVAKTQMTPLTGAWQGAFRELELADGTSGVSPGGDDAPLLTSKGKLGFSDFVAAVRLLIRKNPGDAAGSLPGWRSESSLPSKPYAPFAPRPNASDLRLPSAQLGPLGKTPPPPVAASSTVRIRPLARPEAAMTRDTPEYVYQRRPPPPVVWNALPASFTPWSPADQNMMAYWNVYASGLYQVYTTSTGTWAWGDGINDIAGFVPDADMVAQFGAGAAWGPSELSVTFSRWEGDGPIVESDIAFNPHFAWTTDEAFATQEGSQAWSFRTTALHELGHAWGLQHPWETQRVWWDSIMNYAPKDLRFTKLHADDTQAARSAYPGIAIHDGLLSAYVTGYNPDGTNQAVYTASLPPAVVAAGGTFQLSGPITLENVGTDDIANPRIGVYLTPERISFVNAIPVSTLELNDTIPTYSIGPVHTYDVGTLTVPSQTPDGSYAVAFFLEDSADGYQGNNAAWTSTFIQVQGGANPSCVPDANTACLLNSRFTATVRFRGDFTNQPADTQAFAKPVTGFANANYETSFFYFNDPNNIEILLKMLDQGNVNAQGQPTIAVLFGTATPLRVELTITDTKTGAVRTYQSAFGGMQGAVDFTAFVK